MTDVKMIGPIPQIGYGTWNRDGDEAYNGVIWALEAGYRHIDTAEGYKNEEHVGRAIADSSIPRSDIFLTTKIAPESFAPGNILPTVKASLEKLRTDQVDLLLLHYPSIKDEYDIADYMAQFAEVYNLGLTKHIGVSNFTIPYLDQAVALLGDRKLLTNQCEFHVFMQNQPIVKYSASKGIAMTAYSPLARGAVSDSDQLARIGAKYGATAAQVALAFVIAEGHVVIPSSGNKERIATNLAAKDIALSADDITAIRAMDEGRRLINGPWCPEWDT